MNKTRYTSIKALCALTLMIAFFSASCNKENNNDDPFYENSSITAVTKFKLKADTKVMSNLDSVFFSIDLDHGVIFNADSLPVGTDTQALIPVITYPETVSAAVITMQGGKKKEGEVDYIKNPTDSIDFTGSVTLKLTAEDGVSTSTYRLKVNVHQSDPDSLIWDKIAMAKLPARNASPKAQKTVVLDKKAICMIRENDGTLTLSTTSDIFSNQWSKQALSLDFIPRIETLTATSDALYILTDSGLLKKSTDGLTWSDTDAPQWQNIVGGYGSTLLGLCLNDGKFFHCTYPVSGEIEAETGFPVEGFSNFETISTKWSTEPIGFLIGGKTADGGLTSGTWGFDGNNWVCLTNKSLPAASGMSIVPYFSYKKTAALWIQTEYSVWLALGGRLADGSVNRTVYISFDNGVNWLQGDQSIQLPEFIPALYGASAVVMSTPMDANLADGWTRVSRANSPKRINYNIEGYEIYWDCPYIFMLGGDTAGGTLSDSIWRGVLGRLTFTPII